MPPMNATSKTSMQMMSPAVTSSSPRSLRFFISSSHACCAICAPIMMNNAFVAAGMSLALIGLEPLLLLRSQELRLVVTQPSVRLQLLLKALRSLLLGKSSLVLRK